VSFVPLAAAVGGICRCRVRMFFFVRFPGREGLVTRPRGGRHRCGDWRVFGGKLRTGTGCILGSRTGTWRCRPSTRVSDRSFGVSRWEKERKYRRGERLSGKGGRPAEEKPRFALFLSSPARSPPWPLPAVLSSPVPWERGSGCRVSGGGSRPRRKGGRTGADSQDFQVGQSKAGEPAIVPRLTARMLGCWGGL
jgi:hypothetical protein